MLLPKKWALLKSWAVGLGLLIAVPAISIAGPTDFAKPRTEQSATEHANQRVAEDIAKALSKARLTHKNVQIEFKAGTATISGQIKDQSQRALVTKIVSGVPNVQVVENKLAPMQATRPASANPFAQAAATQPAKGASPVTQAKHQGQPGSQVRPVNFEQGKSNQQVAQQIANNLSKAGLSGYDVEVRYKNGTASLLGSVKTKEQVARAQQATESVPGVQGVLNNLTVNGRPVNIRQASAGPQGAPNGYSPAPQRPQGPQFGGPPPSMPPQGMPPQMRGPQFGAPPQGMPPQGYAPQGAPVRQMQGYAPQGPQTAMAPTPRGHNQPAGHQIYNQPQLPEYAWPSYAPYDNYAAVTYPKQYSANAFPYIGPYHPYPQVPMGWRSSTLEWDDGYWNLKFESRTDKWWWFLHPKNWD